MRRSSADASSASGLRTTAASSAWENSRPIAAPICATSLAGPSRSSRAISEACRLAGTARAGDGTAAAVRSRVAFALRLQHRLGHLLHEQRNAVGALDDVLPDVRRELLVADDAVDHGVDIALRQPIEGEGRHVRPSDPGRLEFRPERHDQQHAKSANPVHHPTERFQARRVDPMRILEDHQHRTCASPAPPFAQLSASSVFCRRCCGAQIRARDSVHRSAATASRQRAPRPARRSRSAPAAHRACRASLAACRRAQIRRHVPSGR